MSRISNAHAVSIVAAPTTTLGQIIAAMPSRSWVALNGTTQNGVACPAPANIGVNLQSWRDDPVQVNSNIFSVYGNKAIWNPTTSCIEMVGRYHDVFMQFNYARYLEATHEVVVSRYGKYPPTQYGTHNFDQHTVNPTTGVNYYRRDAAGNIYYWPSGGNYGVAEDTPNGIQLPDNNASSAVCNGLDWWSGSITGSNGQGLLCAISSLNDTSCYIQFWEPVSNQWLARSTISLPAGSQYNGQLVYSRTKNIAVFCPGHRANNKLWRINPDRSIFEYPGTAPTLVHMTGGHIVADPVTGNFLVHGNYNGSFYEFNPDGNGTWSNLNSGSSALPTGASGVNYQTSSNGSPGILVASLWQHGACAYISTNTGTNSRMHIYKHG